MLALQSYEQNNGFSAMSADELYFINGGSLSTGAVYAICITAGVVGGALMATGNLPTGIAVWKAACSVAGGAITSDLTEAGISAAYRCKSFSFIEMYSFYVLYKVSQGEIK